MNELLRNLYLFKRLSPEHLRMIDEMAELKTYRAKEQIFRQGAESKSLHVIQHGIVTIESEMDDATRIEVATLATGSHFGELGFLDKQPRSATATAESFSEIIEVEYDKLEALLDTDTDLAVLIYKELARFLCSRLRLTTLDLSYSKSQNISHF